MKSNPFNFRKCLVLLLLTIGFGNALMAQTSYYLSSNGNDANDGKSDANAWKTIDKLNATMWSIQAGDRILFRRGDVFEGQINLGNDGVLGNPITLDAYGSGNNPIIAGTKLVTGWVLHSGNIWKQQITAGTVQQLFENDNRLPVGRFPNSGYLRIDSGGSTTSFSDAALTFPNDYFTGANVNMPTSDFNWDIATVSSSNSAGYITYSPATAYNNQADLGYFFTNKLSFIDQENEWAYDNATQTLYLYSSTNPNSRTIQASVFDYGVYGNWNRKFITVQNLQFQNQNMDGIWLQGAPCQDNKILNCQFSGQAKNALTLMGANLVVSNCSFSAIGGLGINGYATSNISIENNQFSNIGMVDGIGNSGVGDLQAIRLWNGSGAFVRQNTITNTGYNGLTVNMDNALIEKNIVTNSLARTADGGCIYSYGANSYNNTIQYNIVSGIVGNVEARPTGTGAIVNAIYLDNNVHHTTVSNNTISNVAGSAMVVNTGAHDNNFNNNVTYKCVVGLGFYDWQAGQGVYANTASGNTFYANVPGAIPVEIASDDNNYNVLTASNNNFLCNPFGTAAVRYIWSNPQQFTLAQWKASSGLDMASVPSYFSWTYPTDNSFIVINNTASVQSYTFTNTVDLNNQNVATLTLQPYSSKVLISSSAVADTQAPSVPVGLSATAISATGFTLNWTASTDNVAVSGYDVYNGAVYVGSTTTALTYSLSGLSCATLSTMSVHAKDAAGNISAASTTLNVSTSGCPDTQAPSVPTGLSATAITATGFTLNWTASSDNVAVTGYDIYRGATLVGSTSTALTYNVSGLSCGTLSAMSVKAKDAAGNVSHSSSTLNVTTSVCADTQAPSVPTGLAATSITTTGFTLGWAASTDNVGVTGYNIYRGLTLLGSTTTARTFNVSGLTCATLSAMSVKAKDAAGNISSSSATLNVTTRACPDTQAPTVPTGLATSSVTTSSFTLSWVASTDNVGVTAYNVYRGGVLIGSTTTATTFAVSGLTANTTYTMTVRAKDAANNLSAASAALNVKTAAAGTGNITTGLQMHLKFSETSGTSVADASGNNNIGSLANGATFAAGKNDNAVALNGSNQYVNVSNSATLNPTTAITLSAWIKSTDLSGNRVIFQKRHYNPAYELAVYGGQLVFNLDGPGGITAAAPATGAWQLLTATYDGSNKKIYLNGALVATAAGTGLINTNPETVFIGTRGSYENFFSGLIDDARIYNRALSATDVLALYNGGAGVAMPTISQTNNPITFVGNRPSMQVFPNPASASEVSLEASGFGSAEMISVTIYDLNGAIVHSGQTYNKGIYQFETSAFPKGMYIISLQGKTQQLFEKLMVQ